MMIKMSKQTADNLILKSDLIVGINMDIHMLASSESALFAAPGVCPAGMSLVK